jgi:hypothetical protein
MIIRTLKGFISLIRSVVISVSLVVVVVVLTWITLRAQPGAVKADRGVTHE